MAALRHLTSLADGLWTRCSGEPRFRAPSPPAAGSNQPTGPTCAYRHAVSAIDEIGENDGWRCWLCDEPVDPDMASHDPRSASIDTRVTKKKAKKKAVDLGERLAHRGCNTGKGNNDPVVAWADHLFVVDPAVIITSVERLSRKGGREAMARCPTHEDAAEAGEWLVDRISRLERGLELRPSVEPGGGQFLVVLST